MMFGQVSVRTKFHSVLYCFFSAVIVVMVSLLYSKSIALLILAGGACLAEVVMPASDWLLGFGVSSVGLLVCMGKIHMEAVWIRIYDTDFILYFMGIAQLFFLHTAEKRNRIFRQVI